MVNAGNLRKSITEYHLKKNDHLIVCSLLTNNKLLILWRVISIILIFHKFIHKKSIYNSNIFCSYCSAQSMEADWWDGPMEADRWSWSMRWIDGSGSRRMIDDADRWDRSMEADRWGWSMKPIDEMDRWNGLMEADRWVESMRQIIKMILITRREITNLLFIESKHTVKWSLFLRLYSVILFLRLPALHVS